MNTLDRKILDRLGFLKKNRWPKALRLEDSSLDLTNGRIIECDVVTLDDFEQCWTETYHKDDQYDFLNHITAGAVAFEVRSIGRKANSVVVQIDDVDLAKILSHVRMSTEYATEHKDISSWEELFQAG